MPNMIRPLVFAGLIAFGAMATRADERLAGIACRSVHWGYSGPAATAFYNEVTIDESADGTYFCVCGFNKGYYGLQELADGKRLLIFSVWDPGKQNDPNVVEEQQRVKLLHRDEAVRVGRFGGEGTGGQSFFDYPWKTGETYRLLVTARADGRWTEFAGWFFVPETKTWRHLVTFATLSEAQELGGYYSFVEDFRRNRESTKKTRTARFGNGWILPTTGEWQSLAEARFTADANPATNINAALRDGRFLLATGGELKNTDVPLTTLVKQPKPPQAEPPEDVRGLISIRASSTAESRRP
jgi:hypothetical protein